MTNVVSFLYRQTNKQTKRNATRIANSGDFAPNRQYWTFPWREKFCLVARRFSGDFSLRLKSEKILAIFGLDWRFLVSKVAFKKKPKTEREIISVQNIWKFCKKHSETVVS